MFVKPTLRYAAASAPPFVFTSSVLSVFQYSTPLANAGTFVDAAFVAGDTIAVPAFVTPAYISDIYPAVVESFTDKNRGDAPTRMFFAFPTFCAIFISPSFHEINIYIWLARPFPLV